jgi:hypothetical protein
MTDFSRLRQQLDANNAGDGGGPHPPSWKAEVGDALVGEIRRIQRGVRGQRDYEPCDVYHIRDEVEAMHAVWASPTVLRSKLKELEPEVGDGIAIKRLPDHHRGYKLFDVVIDRDAPKPQAQAPADADIPF